MMGTMISGFTADQRAYLDAMVGKGMLTWPVVDEPDELRGLDHDVKVAVMTYAGDMFSWYAGSVEADVYFCPSARALLRLVLHERCAGRRQSQLHRSPRLGFRDVSPQASPRTHPNPCLPHPDQLPCPQQCVPQPNERTQPCLPPDDDRLAQPDPAYPLAAWFLGPRAENAAVWQELLDYIFQDYVHWRRNYFPSDPVVVNRVQRRSDSHEAWVDTLTASLDETLNKLKQHFPFHSPRYIAHMLSEQTLPSVLGYFAGMLFNPNNVTAEAAPITVELELEVGRMVAAMLGFNPKRAWAHITSGGTVANLEALWVARTVQFVPLMVQEFCVKREVPFRIHRANGSTGPHPRAVRGRADRPAPQ